MSWPAWPGPQPAPAAPMVVNPAPAVAPPVAAVPAQYSAEQWAQMQQQNWNQWAQWQQQYQQWHQQYGAEYQKSLTAMATGVIPTMATPAPLPGVIPNLTAPPPPAPESKPPPPPPPEDPNPSMPQQPNYNTMPPKVGQNPGYSTMPQVQQQNYQQPPPKMVQQPYQGGFQQQQPPQQQQPQKQIPSLMSQNFGAIRNQNNQNWGNKRPRGNEPNREMDVKAKRQMMESSWNKERPQQQQQQPQQPNKKPQGSKIPLNLEELTEAERKFDKEFAAWEAQFNKWKSQNANHPDKTQYREYEKKWESWRNSLLERREQMRKRRVAMEEKNAAASPSQQVKQPLLPEPVLNKTPVMPVEAVQVQPTVEPIYNKPPPTQNDEPLTFKKKSFPGENLPEHQDDQGESDFLKSSETNQTGGIPGLDLVKDGAPQQIDEIMLPQEDMEESIDQIPEPPIQKGADLDAISKGINTILGDQKLLSMLSTMTQGQQTTNVMNVPKMAEMEQFNKPPPQGGFGMNLPPPNFNEGPPPRGGFGDQNRSFEESHNEGDFNNFDDQTRMSFTGGQGEPETGFGGNNFRNNRLGNNNLRTEFNNRTGGFNTRNEPGFNRNEPGFNRNEPGFNRNEPGFNRNEPGFNRNEPGFNRNEPGFNRNEPGFNRNEPGFNRNQGGFNRNEPGFNRNESGFDRNKPGFGRNEPGFNRNEPGFNRNEPGFNRNEPGFNRNEPGFNRNEPGPGFNRKEPGFNRNEPGFNRNEPGFNRNEPGFNRNEPNFNRNEPGFDRNEPGFNRNEPRFGKGNQRFNQNEPNFNNRNDDFDRNNRFNRNDNFGNRGNNFNSFEDNRNQNFDNQGGFEEDDYNNEYNENYDRNQDNYNQDNYNNEQWDEDEDYDKYHSLFNEDDNGPKNAPPPPMDIGRPPMKNIPPLIPAGGLGRPPGGMPPVGMPPGGMPPVGMSPGGMPPVGMPPGGMPPMGMPTGGMPPIGMSPGGMPPVGIPPNVIPDVPEAPVIEEEEPMFTPEKVTDYEHKSVMPVYPEVALDVLRVFDYRHKPINRIPYPQRPAWLSKAVEHIRQFDPLASRLTFERPGDRFERPPGRYMSPERIPEFDKRSNDRFREGGNRFERRPDDRRTDDDRGRRGDEFRRRDEFSRRNERRNDRDGKDYAGKPLELEELSDDDNMEFEQKNKNVRANDWEDDDEQNNERGDFQEDHDRFTRDENRFTRDENRFTRDDNRFTRDDFREVFRKSRSKSPDLTTANPSNPTQSASQINMIEDLICVPGRYNRPPRIVIILRGPPGSGKTYLAKLIKDKEIENGGSAPRILSLDDYFMVEQEKTVIEEGKQVRVKEMVYEYEAEMEESYRLSFVKAFKKTITDGYFPFIIVDNVNDKVKYFGEMWSFAKQNGFQVYICQLDLDPELCTKRNIHNRSEKDIEDCIAGWEPTPQHHPIVEASHFLQTAITEVEMEEVAPSQEAAEPEEPKRDQQDGGRSKWDSFDCSDNNLARLDGVSKPLRHSSTMEEYLQMDNEWDEPSAPLQPGKKRVRWADLEERKQQEKMRAIGFVVGHTNWDRMMDPTQGQSALTKTKYINRVQKNSY